MDSFIAGFFYGVTTVLVGQPLDTIKTRLQVTGNQAVSAFGTGKQIFLSEGIKGLYRGGSVLILGGALIRSAQFGVNDFVIGHLHNRFGKTEKNDRILGVFDPLVVVAGFAGGIGRGLVEGPFEYIKVRRQVDQPWRLRESYIGAGATMFRNSFLFMFFVLYVDLSKQIIEGGLSPFWTGAVCSNLAWLTIWPLDVVKTQMQSGKFEGRSLGSILKIVIKDRLIFKGLLPGLMRSTVANGLSMIVYKKVEAVLKENKERE